MIWEGSDVNKNACDASIKNKAMKQRKKERLIADKNREQK